MLYGDGKLSRLVPHAATATGLEDASRSLTESVDLARGFTSHLRKMLKSSLGFDNFEGRDRSFSLELCVPIVSVIHEPVESVVGQESKSVKLSSFKFRLQPQAASPQATSLDAASLQDAKDIDSSTSDVSVSF